MKLHRTRLVAAFFPVRLAQWLGPLVSVTILFGLLAILFVAAGFVDTSASKPHPQGWASFLHFVFRRSAAHQSRNAAIPADFGSAAQVAKGATYYGMVCSRCHGGPGLGQNPISLSMRPRPQYLANEVPKFTNRELFWIVKHGVKYSGMSSWPVQDRDDEIWSVVSFLRRMPTMPVDQFRTLAFGPQPAAAGPSPVGALAGGFRPANYALPHSSEPPRESYDYAAPAVGFDAFALSGDPVRTCERCHSGGGAGAAGGAIPNIALLDPTYMKDALTAFSRGTRHSAFMQDVAVQLSAGQIDGLTRYYAAQPKRQSDNVRAPAAMLALGARIAASGLPQKRVGACASCHDITRASGKIFPAIDGQHFAYLRGRMIQFRGSTNEVITADNPMPNESRPLTDREIDAVSLYYAARPPAAPRPTASAPARAH